MLAATHGVPLPAGDVEADHGERRHDARDAQGGQRREGRPDVGDQRAGRGIVRIR
jgi:hypothetical protein